MAVVVVVVVKYVDVLVELVVVRYVDVVDVVVVAVVVADGVASIMTLVV